MLVNSISAKEWILNRNLFYYYLKKKRKKKEKKGRAECKPELENNKPIQGKWIEVVPGDAEEALPHNKASPLTNERSASWELALHPSV